MIVCEYFFKEFHSRGSDEYLNAWVAQVDEMGSNGWKVLDATRRPNRAGLWTVLLVRPAEEFSSREIERNSAPDSASSQGG